METGDIVISRAGHDEGKCFVVTAVVGRDFVMIADGESRKIEDPKLKRIRHLRIVGKCEALNPTNAALKAQLKKFKAGRLYAEK